MKSPLVYLLSMRMKNNARLFFRSPVRILVTLVMFALIGVTIWSGGVTASEVTHYRDIHELYAIVFVLYTFLFIMTAHNGFGQGATLFTLSDTNLLFPAPLRHQNVLFYGLLQQLGSSLMVGIFILFQYSYLHSAYGIVYLDLIWILLAYAVTVFCGQLTAMVIYALTSADPRRRAWVKRGFYALYLLAAAYALARLSQNPENLLATGVGLVTGTPLRFLPMSGFFSIAARGMLSGEWTAILTGFGAAAAYVACLVLLIVRARTDYYEDVLLATEKGYAVRQAAKSGVQTSTGKIRLGRQGLKKGFGASAFYYKHLLENRRSNPLFFDTLTLVFDAVCLAFAWFLRGEGIAPAFVFAVYMQMFGAALGRLPKELPLPFIYLTPEPPFRKLFYALAESLPRYALNAVLLYIPIGLIVGLSPPEILLGAAAGFSFSCLFLAGLVLSERVFGSLTIRALVFMFFFLTMIILAAPGIVLAVVLTTLEVVILSADATIILSLLVCNIPVALLTLYGCRNMLACAELNQK